MSAMGACCRTASRRLRTTAEKRRHADRAVNRRWCETKRNETSRGARRSIDLSVRVLVARLRLRLGLGLGAGAGAGSCSGSGSGSGRRGEERRGKGHRHRQPHRSANEHDFINAEWRNVRPANEWSGSAQSARRATRTPQTRLEAGPL